MLKFTIVDDVETGVLLLQPDYSDPVEIELAVPTAIDPSSDGQETRRAYGESLRYRMAYKGSTDGRARKDFDLALNRLKNQKVVVPYWLEKCEITGVVGDVISFANDKCYTEAARFIAFNDLGDWAYFTAPRGTQTMNSITTPDTAGLAGVPVGSDGIRWIAPMMIARFAKRPECVAETDDTKSYSIELMEQSSNDDRLVPRGTLFANVGAAIADFALTPVWSMRPNFVQPLDTTTIDTLLQQIGYLRDQQENFIDQFPKRGNRMRFTSDSREEAADLMLNFLNRLGPVKRFWLPTFNEDQRMYAATDSATNGLSIEPSDMLPELGRAGRHPGIPFIAIITDRFLIPLEINDWLEADGAHILGTVTDVGETITIAEAPIVSALMLARFAETSLKLTFETDSVWDADVRFVECAEEYNGPDGTEGTVAYLYKFEMPRSALNWYFTSYEKPLTLSSQIYAVGAFDHGTIKKSLNLQGEECTVQSFKGPGNPLMLFIPAGLEAPMHLTILKVDAEAPDGTEKIIFKGEIKNVKATGPRIDALCVPVGTKMDIKVPNFFIQRGCNYNLFGVGTCRLDPDDFEVNGTIDSQDEDNFTIDVLSLTNDGETEADQFFANGWLEIGTGATKEFRAVLRSEAITGGQRLWLNRPLVGIAGTVKFWPGCDWQFNGKCLAFDNQVNFGGFPEMPEVNPTIEAVPQNPGDERRK